RSSTDVVEIEGVTRARDAAANADVVIVVLDGSRPLDDEDRDILNATAQRPRVIAINKADLTHAWVAESIAGSSVVRVSARTGSGLDELTMQLGAALGGDQPERDVPLVTNVRHITLLERARDALSRALVSIGGTSGAMPEEFLLADLQEAS